MIERGEFDEKRHLELIRGELREMAPIGPRHEDVVDALNEWSFQNAPLDRVRVRVQNSIGLPELQTVPQPDLVWAERKRYVHGRPNASKILLVIEVAESSLAYDRREKAGLYAEAGIEDYWIVNLIDWTIVVHRRPRPSGYADVTSLSTDDTASPLRFPELHLPVWHLFQAE